MRIAKQLYISAILILLKIPSFSQAQQAVDPRDYFIKIKTDSGKIKGALHEVADSGIILVRKNATQHLMIPVKDIQYIRIKLKSPFTRGTLTGTLIGAVLGGLAAWKYFVNENDDNLSLLKTLRNGVYIGSGLGFIIGSIAGLTFKVRLPIYKSQRSFNEQRYKLLEYSVY